MIARLFVAAWPPRSVAEHIASLDWSADGVRLTPPEALHVTLRFFGETEVDPVLDRLGTLRAGSAVANIGPRTTTPFGPAILIAPVHGLDALADEIAIATGDLGAPPTEFWGHMEVARASTSVEPLADTPISTTFAVEEIALVESRWVGDGPQFTTLATWPTRPGPAAR